jgi:glycosyltransferase involved in cell wall biosynthesis
MHLVFVQRLGDGSRMLSAAAMQLGIAERVHVLRAVPFDELRALFWGAEVLCHPSLYEGFGNPPAEALAAGCPVVTSNRSSMPEATGGAAILVDPESDVAIADALRSVTSNEGVAASLRVRGIERAKRLRWPGVVERVLAVYRELLAGAQS